MKVKFCFDFSLKELFFSCRFRSFCRQRHSLQCVFFYRVFCHRISPVCYKFLQPVRRFQQQKQYKKSRTLVQRTANQDQCWQSYRVVNRGRIMKELWKVGRLILFLFFLYCQLQHRLCVFTFPCKDTKVEVGFPLIQYK